MNVEQSALGDQIADGLRRRDRHGIAKPLSDVLNEDLAVPRRMWSRIAPSRKRSRHDCGYLQY
jgi:hypothetical protein